jgi:hypothetical protein
MPGAIWWALILLCLVLLGFYAVVRVKRWVTRHDDAPAAGFTLSDLRALHRSGQMTAEEFEKAKTAIVAASQQAAQREEEARKHRQQP